MKKVFNRRGISSLLALTMTLSFITLPEKKVSAKVSEHIVISEAYGGGGNNGATYKQDFIELYNPTKEEINLDGWQIQYASATGSFNPNKAELITNLSGTIKANGYYLIQQAEGENKAGTAIDLPTPDIIGNIAMGGTNFKVRILNSNGEIVDLVGAGTANEVETKAAPAASNSVSVQRKDNNGEETGDTNGWDTDDNSLDFYTEIPTPRNSEFVVEVEEEIEGHIVISEAYGGGGNSGAKYTHDFIELYNPTNKEVNLDGWQIQYASATGKFENNNTNLSGIIKPNGYYLIQQGKGTGGTESLPTPDVTGAVNMAGANFKVKLVDSEGLVVDMLGVGTANEFETSVGPAPSNSTSAQRKDNFGGQSGDTNGWDTDNNGLDFYTEVPTPRNSEFSLVDINLEAIEVTSEIKIEVEEEKVLEVTLVPSNTTQKRLLFESSNKDIATVDENGIIRAISVGETEILVKSVVNESIYSKVKVLVLEKTDKEGPKFSNHAPKKGQVLKDNNRPTISATFSDDSGVNLETFKLYINGEIVTDNIKVNKDNFTYNPNKDFEDGKVTIKVELKDVNGNLTKEEWSFSIGERLKNLYFGQLHSHTNISDGTGSIDEAYTYARNIANVDFLAVTDHSNWFDNDTKASLADGSMSASWKKGHDAANKYNVDDEFVAIYAYEMTWSGSTGGYGHMNTFNTPGFETRTNSAMNLKAYYEVLKTQPQSISMFNHPGKTFGDFQDFAHYDKEIDKLITLIEVGNGEGAVGSSGYFPSYEYYTRALDKGWHVAPTNGQDNHKGKWGNSNTTRTVIEAQDLSRESVYDALREMRVYSTEDENLRISYEVNGNTMGSILEMTDVLDFNINIEDIDKGDTIKKISIIGDGGKVVKSIDNVNSESKEWKFTVPATESYYYYVQVEQNDGQKAVTAPVWVGEKENVGLSSVKINSEVLLPNEKFDVEATVYNNEGSTIQNVKVDYYLNNSNEVLFSDVIEKVESGKTATSKLNTSLLAPGSYKFNVKVTFNLNGIEKEFYGSTEVKIYSENEIAKVVIDGSHQNYYVTGDYAGKITTLKAMMASNNIKPILNMQTITDEVLEGASLLILTDPQSTEKAAYELTPQKYSEEELKAIARFVERGGNIIISSKADYGDGIDEYGSAEQNNAVLRAINAKVRFNDDQATDFTNNGGQEYRLYLNNYNTDHPWFKGVDTTKTYSFYSGSTLIMPEDLSNVQVLVRGHATTFGNDADKKGDNTPVSEGNMVALAVETLKNGSKVVMSGATFLSDFETDSGEYSNTKLTENMIKDLANVPELKVSNISEVRVDLDGDNNPDRFGETVIVEGYVTAASNAAAPGNTFFDVLYIQDETGGLTIFGVSNLSIKLGQKVRIKGKVSSYLGDAQVAIGNEFEDVEIIDDSINLVEPKLMTTKDSMLESNEGWLVKVKGTVTRIEGQNIFVNDGSGESRVYVEGYIRSSINPGVDDEWKARINVGDYVSAIGLASEDPEGQRLRVRDSGEIIIEKSTDPINPTDPVDPINPKDPTDPISPSLPEKDIKTISEIKDKNGVNEIKLDKSSNDVTIIISDIKSIIEGKGSLKIEYTDLVMEIPFKIIDKELLNDDSEITIEVNLEGNLNIIKGLKAVKKVFEFKMFVINSDVKEEIHNFKEGEVKITLILDDEDFEGLDKSNLAVFYYNEETKTYEVLETVIEGNKVIFTTTHFSKFIVSEKSKKTEENNTDKDPVKNPDNNTGKDKDKNKNNLGSLPKTGGTDTKIFVIFAIVIAGVGIFLFKKKQVEVK